MKRFCANPVGFNSGETSYRESPREPRPIGHSQSGGEELGAGAWYPACRPDDKESTQGMEQEQQQQLSSQPYGAILAYQEYAINPLTVLFLDRKGYNNVLDG